MLVGVDTTLAGAQVELVVQAKWREQPNRDAPEHVRDQAELWAGQARTELEWAKSLSKRLSEGAYTMADDPGSGGPGQSRVGGIADRCCHHRSVRARAEPLAAARLSRRGGRDRKGAVVAHRGRRRHAAQALRQTSRTEM